MQQQSPKLNVSLNKTVAFECDECQNQVFIQGVLLRKASKFLTGTTQDAVVPIPIFACSKCGTVNQEFIPKELQTPIEA
jgi:uncharacterized Zn finger protein